MAEFKIMAIKIDHRSKNSSELQDILSKNGCKIKVRLGLHETGDSCSEEGLIILQLNGDEQELQAFKEELLKISSVKLKMMSI